jgi:protein tyrosine/serine phosphatase
MRWRAADGKPARRIGESKGIALEKCAPAAKAAGLRKVSGPHGNRARLAASNIAGMNTSVFLLAAGLLAAGCMAASAPADPAGVMNFHQVDENIYRGAQPTSEGLRNLADMGVKVIVDLRHGKDHSESEQRAAEQLGMRYINVPMEGLSAPTDEQISNLLAVLGAADKGAVFVHCREGKDRTGAVVASYRIAHDHWSNDRALEEAKAYGMSPLQHPRQNYILNFEKAPA